MISKEEAIKLFKTQVPETKIDLSNGKSDDDHIYVDDSKKVSRIDVISNLDVFDAFNNED